jgi:hypothetical protein
MTDAFIRSEKGAFVRSPKFARLRKIDTRDIPGDVFVSGNFTVFNGFIFSVNTSTNVLTLTQVTASEAARVWDNGTPVRAISFGGTLPSPIVEGDTYYIISVSDNTFKLSETVGGSEVDITTSGSGTLAIGSDVNNMPILSNGGMVRYKKDDNEWADVSSGINVNSRHLVLMDAAFPGYGVLFCWDLTANRGKKFTPSSTSWVNFTDTYPDSISSVSAFIEHEGELAVFSSAGGSTVTAALWDGAAWDDISPSFSVRDAISAGGILFACGPGGTSGDGIVGAYTTSWTEETSGKFPRFNSLDYHQGELYLGQIAGTFSPDLPTSNPCKWSPDSGFALLGNPQNNADGNTDRMGLMNNASQYVTVNIFSHLSLYMQGGTRWKYYDGSPQFSNLSTASAVFKYNGSDTGVGEDLEALALWRFNRPAKYGSGFLAANPVFADGSKIGSYLLHYQNPGFSAFAGCCGAVNINSIQNIGRLELVDDLNIISILSISPTTGDEAGGEEVVITGTGFNAGTTVEIGGNPATSISIDSSTQITCDTPAGTGIVDVVVENEFGIATLTNGFEYVPPPVALTIASVSPDNGSTAGGTAVTITGTGFTSDCEFRFQTRFDGPELLQSVIIVSSTEATGDTPAWPHGAGLVDVVVQDTDTLEIDTLANGFEYT